MLGGILWWILRINEGMTLLRIESQNTMVWSRFGPRLGWRARWTYDWALLFQRSVSEYSCTSTLGLILWRALEAIGIANALGDLLSDRAITSYYPERPVGKCLLMYITRAVWNTRGKVTSLWIFPNVLIRIRGRSKGCPGVDLAISGCPVGLINTPTSCGIRQREYSGKAFLSNTNRSLRCGDWAGLRGKSIMKANLPWFWKWIIRKSPNFPFGGFFV